MKYFLAVELEQKPFIQWDEWAKDIVELTEMGEFENPLIVSDDNRPPMQFGVCPLKIVDGQLVERTEQEMEDFETEYNAMIDAKKPALKIVDINNGSFEFGGNVFPTYEAARLRYQAIAADSGKNVTVAKKNGEFTTILSANVSDFLAAYYAEIMNLTNATSNE